jgi:hypothetical protein
VERLLGFAIGRPVHGLKKYRGTLIQTLARLATIDRPVSRAEGMDGWSGLV